MLEILESYLLRAQTALSEYEVICFLDEEGLFPPLAKNPELKLFQKHFITMHALYSLRERWRDEGKKTLSISATRIEVGELRQAQKYIDVATTTDMSSYYLDWSNYSSTTEDKVYEYLADFWRTMARQSPVDENQCRVALKTMGFDASPNKSDLIQRYRQLANRLHPDKGGSAEEFKALLNAYQTLRINIID